MDEVNVIALDLAKNFIHVCATTRDGVIVEERRLRRDKLLDYLAGFAPCAVAMEAGATAHYWGRQVAALGHRPRLLHPAKVKPYMGVQKNDPADGRGIAEAALRPMIRSVPVKSLAQQDLRVLLRLRVGVVDDRRRLITRWRALLGEYGFALPKGVGAFRRGFAKLADDATYLEAVSPMIRAVFAEQAARLEELRDKDRELERQIVALQAAEPAAARLKTVPGIGPIICGELLAAVGDPQAFASGRRLAAWIGLVPRQNSSGGRQRLGGITKHGQSELRRLLVQGARAVIIAANRNQGPPRHRLEAWIRAHQDRLHSNVLAIAVANRIARTAWVVMAREQDFENWPPRRAAA